MTQQSGPSGRETEQQRRSQAGAEQDESWMRDKERQAGRTGYADYAYDPEREREREYGHASAGDRGRGGDRYEPARGAGSRAYGQGYGGDRGEGYASDYGREPTRESGGRFGPSRYGPRQDRDFGRGGREDGASDDGAMPREHARHSGERGLYGAYGPDVQPRGYREDDPRDDGWHASGFDERSQSVGWEDDRGDAPGRSPRFRDRPRQGDPRHGYYVYGGESAGSGGRERLHDYDAFDPRRGRYGEGYGDGGRRMGEGYGRSSGYAGGEFAGSAYGAGFAPNREWSRERAYDAQAAYREPDGSAQAGPGAGAQGGAYREQGLRSQRGRGPRRYARSDERIVEDLNERLTDDELVDASDIEVRCSEGKVVLEGEVEARWMKHRAEDIAEACGGVKDVDNRIRVRTREHAVLSAGPESDGRGSTSERAAQSGGSAAATAPASSASGTGAGRSGNAGAGSHPGTGAGVGGASSGAAASPPGGSTQPH